jgi:thiol-disulfide isomerase/thioredoxin
LKIKINKKIIRNIFFLIILFLSLIPISKAENPYASELPDYEKGNVNIYFFFSPTCPHCRTEEPFLSEMENKYPILKIHYYDASKNIDILNKISKLYSTSTAGVPRTFIGNKVYIGFSKEDGKLEYLSPYKADIGYQNILEQAMINEMNNITSTNNSTTADNNNVAPTNNVNPTNSTIGKFPFWIFSFILIYLLTLPLFYKKINNNETIRRYWIAGLFMSIIILLFLFNLFQRVKLFLRLFYITQKTLSPFHT